MTVDGRGRLIPKLYSKLQANKELRTMLNICAKEAPRDITQLSDAKLIQQLADQAKELGIEIDLNYRFAAAEGAGQVTPTYNRKAPALEDRASYQGKKI